jgi:hypothetical protein
VAYNIYQNPNKGEYLMKIIVTKEKAESGNETGKFKAYPEGKPEIWGIGNSMREAVASLIMDHQPTLGITVDYQ